MGDYLTPVREVRGNLIYTADGRIWANYHLNGINVSAYQGTSIANGQARNKDLFNNLSQIGSGDMLLLGIKAKTSPEEFVDRMLKGIPDIADGRHGALAAHVDAFFQQMQRGKLEEFQRLYILSVEIPTAASGTSGTVAKLNGTDPFASIDRNYIARLETQIFDLLPDAFEPARTTPLMLQWVHERMRLRGIEVPSAPPRENTAPISPKGFGNVIIDKAADTRAVLDEFLEAVDSGAVRATPKRKLGRLRENYGSIRYGQQLSISNPEQRTNSLPDGPTSYQTLMAIGGWPTTPKNALNTFTYLVDQQIGVDADFALRFSFSQDAISLTETRQFLKTLAGENEANSVDEFDAQAYGDRGRERRLLQSQVSEEKGPRGMEVAAIFAFAHPHRLTLTKQVAALKETFRGNGFEPFVPVGGQFELLNMMMPGSSCTPMGTELKGTTTVHAFSACLPLRTSHVGDLQGLPIAINMENALGQIILHDYLGGTEGGNGSIACTGEQGSGKSYFQKMLAGHMSDLLCPAWVIDQSEHGEWVVYAQQLGGVDVIDAMAPQYSLDPLKVLPMERAGKLFVDLMLPLLGLSPMSKDASILANALTPANRKGHGIQSSRDLIDYLEKTADGQQLATGLAFYASQEYTRTLFDPIGHDGGVRRLPAFAPSRDRAVVFRTHGISVHKGDVTPTTEPSKQFGRVLYTAIAAYTAYVFSQSRDLNAFIADEVSFLQGSSVLEDLVRTPDRVGRKAGNIVVAGSQLAKDLQDGNYDQIRKKFAFRQTIRENAIAALQWMGIPATELMIEKMMVDTSPGDKKNNNRAIRGREGEGWYRDGSGSIARVKVLPQASARRHRFSDTTTSSMIRIEDATRATVGGHV
ncbi:ATP-binding protein [Rhodococcus qingshengii]|uniref:ATP-binding protein n=1 Tax=Rhodococcus qingshengii TaxID=334542 RepID=A0AAW6LMV8_RHOSG|nr:ATP-binding protein [Rhodococcus qingshengii]MDE8647531.1 ATP-binding protein [Rhodococcus qingshengii]